jgi:hypothetical protein
MTRRVDLDRLFDEAVDNALEQKEIRTALSRAEARAAALDAPYLRLRAQQAKNSIWSVVEKERIRLLEFDARLLKLSRFIVALAGLIGFTFLAIREFLWPSYSIPQLPYEIFIFAAFMLPTLYTILVLRLIDSGIFRLFSRGSLKSAEAALRQALLEKGTLPFLRNILNERLAPSYSRHLAVDHAPGLSELFDPAYEIATEASTRLHHLIDQLPGGSIGVSGPRGVGKSTLLRAVCSPPRAVMTDKPNFAVMVSAPVEYTSRDFILYLFATICEAVLAATDTSRSRWGSATAGKNIYDYSRKRRSQHVGITIGTRGRPHGYWISSIEALSRGDPDLMANALGCRHTDHHRYRCDNVRPSSTIPSRYVGATQPATTI